jgi:biopolymer transport protein ExbD
MALVIGQVGGNGGDDEIISTINITPLVDVMRVLLIIFPVVTHTVPVELPQEAIALAKPSRRTSIWRSRAMARCTGSNPK